MKSKDNRKLSALSKQPFKIIGSVTTAESAAESMVYYAKPSVPCKLIGARLNVVTAAGASLSATAKFTKETAVTDPDLGYDKLVFGFQLNVGAATKTSVAITEGTAVSSDDIMQLAAASVASATSVATAVPGANFLDAANYFNPKDNDALRIDLPCASHATNLIGTLELEFLPI